MEKTKISNKLNNSKQQAQKVAAFLKERYLTVQCPLDHKTAWQLLVATILSAQCTDERVNLTTPNLFARFPNSAATSKADLAEITSLLKSINFFNNKAKNILATAKKLELDFNGQVPNTMEQLLTLPGVARKTANVVLGNWYKINVGFTVDTHVIRLSNRLGLTDKTDAVKIEQDLIQLWPQEDWSAMSLRLIFYGREVCTAKNPKCAICPLNDICPSAYLFVKPVPVKN